jgi:hypothetical protein
MPVCQHTVIISGPLSYYRRTTSIITGVYRFKVDLSPGVPKEDVDNIIADIAATIRRHHNVTYIEATPPRPT